MKKTLLALVLALGLCFLFVGCGMQGDGGDTNVTYTITFKQSGEADVVKTVKKGESLKDVPTPKPKTGYTVEWDKTVFTSVSSNIVVNAVATANKYTVTYDANGGSVKDATQEVTYDAVTTLQTPTREDYYFLCWTYNDNAVVSGEKWTIADDVTLVGSWQDQRPEYTVTFIDGNQSNIVTVKKGDSVAEEDVPVFAGKVGHTAAWDNDDFTNVTENMTITAVYSPITYTVTYSAEGFDVHGDTVQLTYGEACTGLATLSSEGQTFVGWLYDGKTYTEQSVWDVAEDDVVLTASWITNSQVVISFKDTNGTIVTKAVYSGETLTDIPTPSLKVGYTVDVENWYADEGCTQVANYENLQQNTMFYSKAVAKNYTITYNSNGGNAVAETTVTYDSAYALTIPTHSLDYMEFVAWKDAEGNIVANEGKWTTDSGKELTAEWKDARKTYTITFEQKDEEVKTFTIKEGESFTEIPSVVEKTGYNIAWDEDAIAKLTNVSDNVKVTAKISAKTYEIVLNTKGGEVEEVKITVTYGEAYELPEPARSGFTFEYWTYNGEKIEMKGTWNIDAENIELVAKWEDSSEWTGNY